ncbi:MAG: ABC transporter ATP-binding protein [Candidatus Thorarchaeota archaeon]
MAEAHIKITNLNKRFGKLYAINNVALEVERGEYIVILGPTGAGKTTLLKLIAGLVKPTSGTIFKNGEILNQIPPEKRNMAYLPQTEDYSLFPYMSVWENTIFSPKVKGEKPWDEVVTLGDEILDLVNLRTRYNAYPHELSGGMKQRVALARAIAADADIFLLDEPLRALDARLRIRLRTELRKLVSDLNKTTFHVTHDQEEALAVADKVLIINEGKIIQFDIPEEIYYKPSSLFSAHFFGTTNLIPATKIKNNGKEVTFQVGEAELIIHEKNVIYRLNQNKDEFVLAIKADSIKPFKTEISRDQSNLFLRGVVERSFFLGKWANIVVNIERFSKEEIEVIIPSVDLPEYEIGTKINLKIPHDAIMCFNEPWEIIKQMEAI